MGSGQLCRVATVPVSGFVSYHSYLYRMYMYALCHSLLAHGTVSKDHLSKRPPLQKDHLYKKTTNFLFKKYKIFFGKNPGWWRSPPHYFRQQQEPTFHPRTLFSYTFTFGIGGLFERWSFDTVPIFRREDRQTLTA